MSCRAQFSNSRYCGPSHSAGKRGGEKLKSVGVNSEFVGIVGRCGQRTRMESFVCVFFLVVGTGTGTAGDGDSSGLLFFLLFFLAFLALVLGFDRWTPFSCWFNPDQDVATIQVFDTTKIVCLPY